MKAWEFQLTAGSNIFFVHIHKVTAISVMSTNFVIAEKNDQK